MYILVIEHRRPIPKTSKWIKYTQYVCFDKKDLDSRLSDRQWVNDNYNLYRMTYYKVDLSTAVTVQSKVVYEEVK